MIFLKKHILKILNVLIYITSLLIFEYCHITNEYSYTKIGQLLLLIGLIVTFIIHFMNYKNKKSNH